MKKILLLILIMLPTMLTAQEKTFRDLRAGESVQFEQGNDVAYVLVAIRIMDKESGTYGAIVQFDREPNPDNDVLCFCEFDGNEIQLIMVDAPIKPAFYLTLEGDDAWFRVGDDPRKILLHRKPVKTKL